MEGSKTTYIMPEGGSNNDLATMAMMNNGGFGNGMWNNPLIKC